jgi:hypothetical protein
MSITADVFVAPPQPIVAAVPPPQPRTVVAPATERENAQNQRRDSSKNQNGPLSFRAALNAASFSGIAAAKTASETSVWLDEDDVRPQREARLPNVGPIELTGAEASDLFTRAVANNERKGRAPAFAAAASQYATSFFAGSPFYAKPGQTLELTA